MRCRARLVAPVVAALVLLAGALGAQEPITRARRLLLFFYVSDDAQYGEVDRRLLRESLLARLAVPEAPYRVVEWGGRGAVPSDEAARTEAALESNCDAWAAVELLGSAERPGYRLWSFDLAARKRVADETVSRDTPLRPRDLERRFWDEAAASLSASFQSVEMGTRVTFWGVPATVVAGLDSRVVLDELGVAEVVLANPSLYTVRTTHPRYIPVTLTFSVKDEAVDLELNQRPAPRHMVDVSLTTLSFLSADWGFYLRSNYAYLKVGLTTYVLGITLSGAEGESPLVTLPLTDLRLHAGSYINAPDAPIRYYGSLGAVLRLVHSREYFGAEPLAPLGLQLALGMEARPWRWSLAFLELAPTCYFSGDSDLLAASYPEEHNPFNTAVFGWGLIDFLHYRIGVRVQL